MGMQHWSREERPGFECWVDWAAADYWLGRARLLGAEKLMGCAGWVWHLRLQGLVSSVLRNRVVKKCHEMSSAVRCRCR